MAPPGPFILLLFSSPLLSDLPHQSGPGLPVAGGLGKVEVSFPWPQNFNSWGVAAMADACVGPAYVLPTLPPAWRG